eukprot:1162138-Pelagomonas_calceolata.AAC.2
MQQEHFKNTPPHCGHWFRVVGHCHILGCTGERAHESAEEKLSWQDLTATARAELPDELDT